MYVDNTRDEPSLARNNQDKDFNNNNLTNINSITLKTQAVNDNHVITETYVDQIHQVNEQFGRDLGIDFDDESSDLVKNNEIIDLSNIKLTNLDSNTVNWIPTSDNELGNKKYIDDELDKKNYSKF